MLVSQVDTPVKSIMPTEKRRFTAWSAIVFCSCFFMVCVASQNKIMITSSQQFYMSFRKAPDMATRQTFVKTYKDFAEAAFYDHIVRMLSDRSFREAAPVEYRNAITMGLMLANLYNEEYQDARLLDIYRKLKLEDRK
jgi:hypothetical protein